jgi:hypothetical protein
VDDVDTDTLSAVKARWETDTQSLPALLDRGLAAGPVKSPREQPLTLPYAQASCESVPGKSQRYVKGIRKDVRKVTLSVWGTHEQASAALQAILTLFNSRIVHPALPYPSGARLIKWWPLNDGTLTKEIGDAAQKAGEDVWQARVEAEVYSVRDES